MEKSLINAVKLTDPSKAVEQKSQFIDSLTEEEAKDILKEYVKQWFSKVEMVDVPKKTHAGIIQIETQDGFKYGDVIDSKGDRLTDLLLEYEGKEIEVAIKVIE